MLDKDINLYSKYFPIINNYYYKIDWEKLTKTKIQIIKELYSYVKDISLDLYKNDESFSKNFSEIAQLVLKCERKLPRISIADIQLNYGYDNNLEIPKFADCEQLLNYIAACARNFIIDKTHNLEDINLVGMCIPTSIFIDNLCKQLNIKSHIIRLFPGFTKEPILYKKVRQHYLNIIELNQEKYLIDCTYGQFFYLNRNILERLGICKLGGCSVGIFMLMDKARQDIAKEILKNGFIKLNDRSLKAYLDGFAISYRNGLYYEQKNDFSYTTLYTALDYKNFLKHEDNQVNYEGNIFLNQQQIPLKNPHLDFGRKLR